MTSGLEKDPKPASGRKATLKRAVNDMNKVEVLQKAVEALGRASQQDQALLKRLEALLAIDDLPKPLRKQAKSLKMVTKGFLAKMLVDLKSQLKIAIGRMSSKQGVQKKVVN